MKSIFLRAKKIHPYEVHTWSRMQNSENWKKNLLKLFYSLVSHNSEANSVLPTNDHKKNHTNIYLQLVCDFKRQTGKSDRSGLKRERQVRIKNAKSLTFKYHFRRATFYNLSIKKRIRNKVKKEF